MRGVAVAALLVLLAAWMSDGAVFERYLSIERPADRAIMAYLELEKKGEATSRDLAELGVLLLNKGFPKDAERYLRKSIKLDKENFEAAYRLGLVLQREGRDREAARYYKKVIKQRPGHAYARFMLALAEERSGHREAAIRDYAKAYRFVPELAWYDKNPLLYASKLQVSAALERYRREVNSSTLEVAAIDPAHVAEMMQIGAPIQPTPTPAPQTPPPPVPPTVVSATPAAAATPATTQEQQREGGRPRRRGSEGTPGARPELLHRPVPGGERVPSSRPGGRPGGPGVGLPTMTPPPSPTPEPTAVPEPTGTPEPSATPTPEPAGNP